MAFYTVNILLPKYLGLRRPSPRKLGMTRSELRFRGLTLTLILLTWRIWWAPNNASKWQMGFNVAFKGLIWRATLRNISLSVSANNLRRLTSRIKRLWNPSFVKWCSDVYFRIFGNSYKITPQKESYAYARLEGMRTVKRYGSGHSYPRH